MSDKTEQIALEQRERLLRKANVVGVAGGEDKVIVLVTEKKPLADLNDEDVVEPRLARSITDDEEEAETDVIEVGHVTPKTLVPGSSIGLKDAGTGTLGGLVVDENDALYFLTNNHVAADSNRALALTPVHSPGPADGFGERIGVLSRFEPIYFDRENYIDAALIRAEDSVSPWEAAHTINATTTARTGWQVQKYGRTSGHSEGEVLARGATIDVDFGSQGVARFVDQILTTPMLEAGDSGSVLLSTSGHPCALGFAGSDQVSIWTPINLVLRTLAVRFA